MSGAPASDGIPALHQIAASLRMGGADLTLYADLLTRTLADILPPGVVTVRRRSRVSRLLGGAPGAVESISIADGDQLLRLTATRQGLEAEHAHVVLGVTLSTARMDLDRWIDLLAALLSGRAERDERAAAAVRRLLGAG